jgi:hypothetical protein
MTAAQQTPSAEVARPEAASGLQQQLNYLPDLALELAINLLQTLQKKLPLLLEKIRGLVAQISPSIPGLADAAKFLLNRVRALSRFSRSPPPIFSLSLSRFRSLFPVSLSLPLRPSEPELHAVF